MGLGLHGGGVGLVKFLVRAGAVVMVTDLRTPRQLAPSLQSLARYRSIRYVLGRHRNQDVETADLVIKNPGVRPDSPYLGRARLARVPITSEMGIFFRLCPARIISITGSRGKSTAAFLVHAFLKIKRRDVHLGGNIRRSAFDLLPVCSKKSLVVLELSSFQLDDLAHETWEEGIPYRRSPGIAVITNIYRDHLNWHPNLAAYQRAKGFIFKYQKSNDHLFVPVGDPTVAALARRAPSVVHRTTLPSALRPIVDQNLGFHYRSSVGLAVAVARHFNVPVAAITRVLKTFRGLPARQEEIAVVGGVHFVNDTTATSPEASVAAIERFSKKVGKNNKLILIAGGSDKKLEFRDLARAIQKKVDITVLLPGGATEKLRKHIRTSQVRILKASSMREAVQKAYRAAEKGDWVVLSPGAASFGLFLNEFDRGEQFIAAVQQLKSKALRRP